MAPEFKREHETGLVHARADNGTRIYYWLDEECAYAKMAYAQLEK